MVGLIMASLETQYKMFIKYNPKYSDWTYPEWLKWHSEQIAEAINNIEPDVVYLRDKLSAALKVPKAFMGYEKDLTGKTVSDDFQIGPDGAYEATEEWELYQQYQDEFAGYEDVPSYNWFVNELKTNEKFKDKYGKSNT